MNLPCGQHCFFYKFVEQSYDLLFYFIRQRFVGFVQLAIGVVECIDRCTLDVSIWYLLAVFSRFSKSN